MNTINIIIVVALHQVLILFSIFKRLLLIYQNRFNRFTLLSKTKIDSTQSKLWLLYNLSNTFQSLYWLTHSISTLSATMKKK